MNRVAPHQPRQPTPVQAGQRSVQANHVGRPGPAPTTKGISQNPCEKFSKSPCCRLSLSRLWFLMEPLFSQGDWRWIIFIVFGVVVYVLLGTHGDRIGRTVGKFRNRFFRQPQSRTATVAASRVPTSVDPEQSEVSYYGPNGLMVAVFMTVENHLDVEIRLKKLALDVEMVAGCLNCRFLEFQPCLSLDRVKTVGNIMVPARQALEGWAHFQCKDNIRIVDFRRFVFVAQAIGEPEQVYTFEPYDWDHARRGQSTIVMPPPGTDT